MHRRKFLKLIGLSGGAAVVATTGVVGVTNAASTTSVAPNPDAIGVLHDSTLCIGCRQCEEACAEVHNRPAPKIPFSDLSVLNKKRRTSANIDTVVNKYTSVSVKEDLPGSVFRKIQCNHCQEPACAAACFVKAFVKNPDGSVTYDPSLCVGCRYCMIACPFNILSYDYDKVINPLVHKCTLCEPRLLEGKLPGCVVKCPTGALLFGKRTDLVAVAHQRIAKTPGKYVNHLYGEKEMGGTNWLYLSPVPHEELGQPVLGAASVPELTSGALGAVPMVAGLWPVFLTGAYAITKRKEKIAAEEQASAVETALKAAEQKALATLKTAVAKAEKDKETALAKAAKEQEAALIARETELAAEMEKIRTDAEKALAKAKKTVGKTALKPAAKAPGKPSGKQTVPGTKKIAAAPKKAPGKPVGKGDA